MQPAEAAEPTDAQPEVEEGDQPPTTRTSTTPPSSPSRSKFTSAVSDDAKNLTTLHTMFEDELARLRERAREASNSAARVAALRLSPSAAQPLPPRSNAIRPWIREAASFDSSASGEVRRPALPGAATRPPLTPFSRLPAPGVPDAARPRSRSPGAHRLLPRFLSHPHLARRGCLRPAAHPRPCARAPLLRGAARVRGRRRHLRIPPVRGR